MPTDDPNTINAELQVLPQGALEILQRAEIDMQISTAKKFPRSMTTFKQGAIDMATIDEETAESCLYSRPVGKGDDGKQKNAEGMSIRMAEIVAANYGNIRVYTTTIEQNERFCRVRGMAIDLQNNYAASSEVSESTVDRRGDPYSERQRMVTLKAAHAKAYRDATFKVVPRALARPVEAAVRKLLTGDEKSLSRRRGIVVKWIEQLKIDPKRVWNVFGVKGPDDLSAEDLATLTGIRTALNDKETTLDEAFPPSIPVGNVGTAQQQATPVEQAAAEKKKPEPKAEEPSTGPSAADLRKQLIAKGTEINVGKVKIAKALAEMKFLSEGQTLDDIDAKALANILDGWSEIKDRILNPGEPS